MMPFPPQYSLFGVSVSVTTYEETIKSILNAAKQGVSATVTHLAVHGLIIASNDCSLREKVNSFEIVVPDGQPVKAALNLLFDARLPSSVRGPGLMLKLIRCAAEQGVGVYFYGSHMAVVSKLREELTRQFPDLKVMGCEPSAFRPLNDEEDYALVERINESGAGILFLGLGCPLQEHFAFSHRNKIRPVQLCVGAAFDFLAGNKKQAPEWIQHSGFEWFYRLCQEPNRLWKRYLFTNTIFVIKLISAVMKSKGFYNKRAAPKIRR